MSREIKWNRETYIRSLRHELRRLPREDFESALCYFEEYFDEAGPENEAQAIEDLGAPKQAAEQVIVDMAVKNGLEPESPDVKKGLRSVWIGILALFAAPIALPLAFSAVVLIASFGFSAVCLLFSLVLCGAGLLLGGIVSGAAGLVYMFRFPADAFANIGIGLISLGVGAVLTLAGFNLTRRFLTWMTRMLGRMAGRFSKGGRDNEER